MAIRLIPACFLSSWLVSAILMSVVVVEAAGDPADLQPGTKVIADVGGESTGEVLEKVGPGVYRVRVKIRTGDVIEPVLPIQRLRLAQAEATAVAPATKPNAATAVVAPGTTTPGSVTPGTVTQGTAAPGTVTPGTTTTTITRGAVQGSVTVTPGTVTPGIVTPGTVTPGTITQRTTSPTTISQGIATPGTVTPGTVTPGTVTPGTVTPGTATSGTATSGTVIVNGGTVKAAAVGPSIVREAPLAMTPAGKAELQSLVGTWNIVTAQRNGQVDSRAPMTITISPTSIAIDERVFDQVRIDPTSDPRRFDLAKAGERQLRGIYKRTGDRLRICFTDADDSIRPTEFTTTDADGHVVFDCELRR